MKLPSWSREKSEGPPCGPFVVQPTVLRFGVGGDYIIQVNQKIRTNIGRYVIVSNCIADADRMDVRAVLAKVTVYANLGDNEIRMDQTLREALLINAGNEVYLYKKAAGSPGQLLDWLFKPKRLWAYVYRSYRRDMEKGLCGMSAMTMNILGLSSRDQLKVEYVLFDSKDSRFKIGTATPTVFELPIEDVKHTINQVAENNAVRDFILPSLDDTSRLRLPFVRLDLDLRLMLANENLESWRIKQESESAFSEEGLYELPLLVPVRLSPSLPFILKSRSVFHGLNAFIGLLSTVIAFAELSVFAGAVIGGVYLMLLLPITIFWDIKRRIS